MTEKATWLIFILARFCSMNVSKQFTYFILPILILFSKNLPLYPDDIEKVKSIQAVISTGERYKLHPIELFDGESLWKIYRSSSYLESTRFVLKSPSTEAFKLESGLYYSTENDSKRKSIQIHSNIEIPGRDKIFIKPEIQKAIPSGLPIRIFFWVYSNNYDLNLKVILARKKSQDIIVDFGLLKFNGWRRLDSRINDYKPQDRLNTNSFNQYELKGILIESTSFQPKGSFYLFIDQMGILIEKPDKYPGSELPDGWDLY